MTSAADVYKRQGFASGETDSQQHWKESREGAEAIVYLEGRLDALTAPETEKKIMQLKENGTQRLKLDCTELVLSLIHI